MKSTKTWKSILSFIVLVIWSVVGNKPNSATAKTLEVSQTNITNNETTIAQACPYNNPRLRYGRVATQDGDDLYIRPLV